jgi:hypothetical protein
MTVDLNKDNRVVQRPLLVSLSLMRPQKRSKSIAVSLLYVYIQLLIFRILNGLEGRFRFKRCYVPEYPEIMSVVYYKMFPK